MQGEEWGKVHSVIDKSRNRAQCITSPGLNHGGRKWRWYEENKQKAKRICWCIILICGALEKIKDDSKGFVLNRSPLHRSQLLPQVLWCRNQEFIFGNCMFLSLFHMQVWFLQDSYRYWFRVRKEIIDQIEIMISRKWV